LRDGFRVRGVDALTDYYDRDVKLANLTRARSHEAFNFIEADLNATDLQTLLDGVDLVFHLAGQPGVRGSWGQSFSPYVKNNVEATQRLLEACRTVPIERFVYASSSSVYGRIAMPMREDAPAHPHSPYGVTKLAGELLCLLYSRNFGLPACAVRYFTVFGPRQRPDMDFAQFFRAIRDADAIRVFGDGSQTRDFTYVEDAVAGTCLAAERGVPGEVYNLGGGCRVSVNDVIAVIERDCGRRARIEHGPTESGDVVTTLADTTKAVTALGYRPCVDLERGLWNHARSLGLLPTYRARRSAMAATPRILLYSHDTFGLGHLRRNLAIAANLLDGKRPYDVTLLSGSPVLATSAKPPGLRVVALPPVVKVGAEHYRARDASLSFEQVKADREAVIRETIASFAPDVFLIDHAPAGMRGELLQALAYLRREMPDTKVAIALRDIVDEPNAVRSLWREHGVYNLLSWAYDRILVYGSRHLFDVGRQYGFDAALINKVRYCGYVARKLPASQKRRKDGFSVLVTTGGGGDGFPLVRDYLHASRDFAQRDLHSTVVSDH
jgi:UDP-glucuronate 4-epimerase